MNIPDNWQVVIIGICCLVAWAVVSYDIKKGRGE